MTKRHLDKAAEFCRAVGANNLFGYLNLPESASGQELSDGIRDRRKWAQSQQNNPKYKDEAKLFISHQEALLQVALEPQAHLRHQRKVLEEANLPSLQMAIDAIIRGGQAPSTDQLAYLETLAIELQISHATLRQLLSTARETLSPSPARTHRPDSGATLDRDGPTVDRPPPISQRSPLQTPPPSPNMERHRTPRGPAPAYTSRSTPTISRSTGTGGPPRGSSEPTAPPVRRVNAPNSTTGYSTQPPINDSPTLGRSKGMIEPVGQVHIGQIVYGRPVTLSHLKVRFIGALPLDGQIQSDADWLEVEPKLIRPLDTPPETTTSGKKVRIIPFQVTIHPSRMPGPEASGSVTVLNSTGDRATYRIDATRTFNWLGLIKASTALVLILLLLAGVSYLAMEILTPRHGKILVIRLDPSAEVVMLDEQVIGRGTMVRHLNPAAGERRLTIVQPNFRTVERTITIRPQEEQEVMIELELDSDLSYSPQPDEKRVNPPPGTARVAEDAISPCLDLLGGTPVKARAEITIVKNGHVGAIRIDGKVPEPASTCIKRRLAAVRTDPLSGGDYAKVTTAVQHP